MTAIVHLLTYIIWYISYTSIKKVINIKTSD